MKRFWVLFLIAAISVSTGCTSAVKNTMRLSEKSSQWNPLAKLTPERKENAKEEAEPVSMAAIWKDTKMSPPGKRGMRGFGGRIYFYDQSNNPVKADGELIVYGFDNESDDANKPKRKFVFKKEDLQEHFSESALGGSYSFWLPWDQEGGFEKTITLIPIFKTTDGRVIQSGQSINVLPGRIAASSPAALGDQPYRYLGSSSAVIGHPGEKGAESGVTRASYAQEDVNYEDLNKIKTRVTSISLTHNLQKMVNNATREASKAQSKSPVDAVTPSQAVVQASAQQQPASKPQAVSANTSQNPSKGQVSRSVYGAPGPLYR